MAQAALKKFLIRCSFNSYSPEVRRALRHARGCMAMAMSPNICALLFAGMLAIAPLAFAQHGGGGGGGGGNHGGGGGLGGGSHGGGGGGAHSGGGAGGGSHSAVKGGVSPSGSIGGGGFNGSPSRRPQGTDAVGAFRRVFGFFRPTNSFAKSSVAPDSSVAVLYRAAEQASLPPAFSHIRLGQPSLATADSAERGPRASLISATLPVSAIVRPIRPPFPPRYPIVYGGGTGIYGGYGGFYPVFGFGFFDFFLDSFGYFNGFGPGLPSGNYSGNLQAADVMLLYLNDGSALEVTDYWFEGDTLDYVSGNGRQSRIPVRDLDIQRTTEANARVGFRFNLDRMRRGTPLDRDANFGNTSQSNSFASGAGLSANVSVPVVSQDVMAKLVDAVSSPIPVNGLDVRLSGVVRHADGRTADVIVQLNSRNLTFVPTDSGENRASLVLEVASLDQGGTVLASKIQTMALQSTAQDPILLPEGSWSFQLTIPVPPQTNRVRVVIEDQDGGQMGAADLDRKEIDAAPATTTPDPQPDRRPEA